MVKDMPNKFSEVTPEIKELAKKCNKKIDYTLSLHDALPI